jgi:predicted nuclease of restriction endonuclease-like (RecB) superfamily
MADDLSEAFPGVTGFRLRNLRYMRALADALPDPEFVQQVVAQLPWGHNVRFLDLVRDPGPRQWYMRQAVQNGWSRNVLVHQTEGNLIARQGAALTNFSRTLPAPQSELARQQIKDPYNFDFLSLGPEMSERDLERGLLEQLRNFFLELGKGFAFVGSQYPLDVGGQDYFIDLLFYHLHLRCFVVIDLKIEDFKPEFAGKMNFYLSAVDDAWDDLFVKEWLTLPPRLADRDLRGVLYVSREHAPLISPQDRLSSEAAELLAALLQHPDMAANLKERLRKIARPEITIIMDRLLDRARQEQEFGVPADARIRPTGGSLRSCFLESAAGPGQPSSAIPDNRHLAR